MSIWDKHPNYTPDELQLLVKATAAVLSDAADAAGTGDPEILEIGPRAAARTIARDLQSAGTSVEPAQVEQVLTDRDTVQTVALATLDEVRKHPPLAARVAEVYEDQRSKMLGVETLLVGALLVLAMRIKSVSVGPPGSRGVKVDFYESGGAVKGVLLKLLGL